jgi:hypothetical protein
MIENGMDLNWGFDTLVWLGMLDGGWQGGKGSNGWQDGMDLNTFVNF